MAVTIGLYAASTDVKIISKKGSITIDCAGKKMWLKVAKRAGINSGNANPTCWFSSGGCTIDIYIYYKGMVSSVYGIIIVFSPFSCKIV